MDRQHIWGIHLFCHFIANTKVIFLPWIQLSWAIFHPFSVPPLILLIYIIPYGLIVKIKELFNFFFFFLLALGQVMLYVDGMNGVMEHNETVQWLYALIASKFRLVVKTALKLLLVFVEYVETNCLLLIKAVHAVDTAHGRY